MPGTILAKKIRGLGLLRVVTSRIYFRAWHRVNVHEGASFNIPVPVLTIEETREAKSC
jgi:hypothetical protein